MESAILNKIWHDSGFHFCLVAKLSPDRISPSRRRIHESSWSCACRPWAKILQSVSPGTLRREQQVNGLRKPIRTWGLSVERSRANHHELELAAVLEYGSKQRVAKQWEQRHSRSLSSTSLRRWSNCRHRPCGSVCNQPSTSIWVAVWYIRACVIFDMCLRRVAIHVVAVTACSSSESTQLCWFTMFKFLVYKCGNICTIFVRRW